ncbi:hypothetical protein OAA09_00610 [bacterium]|nr:hypothetical protein [bacterium]
MNQQALRFLAICALIATSGKSYANDLTVSEDLGAQAELVTTLEKDEKAPFSGTLFSTAAAASLLANLQMNDASCELKIKKEVEINTAEFQLQIDNLNASLTRVQTNHNEILLIKSNQIDYLDTQLEKASKPNRELWFALGVVGGVLITGTAAWSMGQITNQQ